jgi:hypothetical protein
MRREISYNFVLGHFVLTFQFAELFANISGAKREYRHITVTNKQNSKTATISEFFVVCRFERAIARFCRSNIGEVISKTTCGPHCLYTGFGYMISYVTVVEWLERLLAHTLNKTREGSNPADVEINKKEKKRKVTMSDFFF